MKNKGYEKKYVKHDHKTIPATESILHYSQDNIKSQKLSTQLFEDNCRKLCDASPECKAIVVATDHMNCWLKDEGAAKMGMTSVSTSNVFIVV